MRPAACPQPAPASPQAGTSLVELVIASTIVITLLLVISTSTATQSRLRKVAEERNLAMAAIRNKLEGLREVPTASLLGLNGVGFDVPGTNGEAGGLAPVAGDSDDQPGAIKVVVDASAGTETLYKVTLTVDWHGAAGNQSFAVTTLIAERK